MRPIARIDLLDRSCRSNPTLRAMSASESDERRRGYTTPLLDPDDTRYEPYARSVTETRVDD